MIGPALENEAIEMVFRLTNTYSVMGQTRTIITSYRCFKDKNELFQRQFRTASCIAGTVKLRFYRVQKEDAGNYTCVLNVVLANHSLSATIKLEVLQKPDVEEIDLQLNKTVNLTCSGYLNNSPVIWYKGEIRLNCTSYCFQLTLKNVAFDDAGEYHCKRVNTAAEVSTLKMFYVKVSGYYYKWHTAYTR